MPEPKEWRVVPALDCSMDRASTLVAALGSHRWVHGFKLGFALGLSHGLPEVVRVLAGHTDKPLIYDHQKAGTDIPATGALFADVLAGAGIGEAILFPQAGPATLEAWVRALQERGLAVIVGGVMTHPAYLASEGGFLVDDAGHRMFAAAAAAGVRSFVVPLTKPAEARAAIEAAGVGDCTFYSPGYGKQGGDPSRFHFVRRHRVIVGRALLGAPDPVEFVDQMHASLVATTPEIP